MKTQGTNPIRATSDYSELEQTDPDPWSETQRNPVHAASLAWEEAHWREHHATLSHAKYGPYESFHDAYRAGYAGYFSLRLVGTDFDEIESDIRERYETGDASPMLPWAVARPAAQAAWQRLAGLSRQ